MKGDCEVLVEGLGLLDTTETKDLDVPTRVEVFGVQVVLDLVSSSSL